MGVALTLKYLHTKSVTQKSARWRPHLDHSRDDSLRLLPRTWIPHNFRMADHLLRAGRNSQRSHTGQSPHFMNSRLKSTSIYKSGKFFSRFFDSHSHIMLRNLLITIRLPLSGIWLVTC